MGQYLIKARWYHLGSFTADPRSLNDFIACCKQVSQVSAQLGDQSGLSILRVQSISSQNQMTALINLTVNKTPFYSL